MEGLQGVRQEITHQRRVGSLGCAQVEVQEKRPCRYGGANVRVALRRHVNKHGHRETEINNHITPEYVLKCSALKL